MTIAISLKTIAILPTNVLLTIIQQKAEVVRVCVAIQRTCQDHPAGHRTRREKERQTEEEVGRQYQRVDRPDLRQLAASCRGQRPMEEDHPGVISGASTTPLPGLGDRRSDFNSTNNL